MIRKNQLFAASCFVLNEGLKTSPMAKFDYCETYLFHFPDSLDRCLLALQNMPCLPQVPHKEDLER